MMDDDHLSGSIQQQSALVKQDEEWSVQKQSSEVGSNVSMKDEEE